MSAKSKRTPKPELAIPWGELTTDEAGRVLRLREEGKHDEAHTAALEAIKAVAARRNAPPPGVAERLCGIIEGFDRGWTVAVAFRSTRRRIHELRNDATAIITDRPDMPPLPPLVEDDNENLRAMREWLTRALSFVEANPAAPKGAPKADDSNMFPAKECLIGGINDHKALKRYLAKHPEIHTDNPRPNRLRVHLAHLRRALVKDAEAVNLADGEASRVAEIEERKAEIKATKTARGK